MGQYNCRASLHQVETIKGKGFNYSLETVGHYENDSFFRFRGRVIEYDPEGPIEYINYYDFDADKKANQD